MNGVCATIDVIVPVYRGEAATRRCIDSVLGQGQRAAFEVIVVDDASPEPAISAWLDSLHAAGRITLVRNAANQGFVRSVNAAMALHADRDVVLLNSDTEVANDWLDRLVACAARDSGIATVTPFSNCATICSYPFDGWTGGIPGRLGLAVLDRIFATANDGRSAEIPTGVGFCLYIRRNCLDALGEFDAERFGRGYGEENDFCLRAADRGWRNVVAADVFVFHEGAVSFSGEREALTRRATAALLELHPDYQCRIDAFVASDPLQPFRAAVDDARFAQGVDEARRVLDERRAGSAQAVRSAVTLRDALGHAQTLVAERDVEIAKLTSAFAHAESLALARGEEIDRINASTMGKIARGVARGKARLRARYPARFRGSQARGVVGMGVADPRVAEIVLEGVAFVRDGAILVDRAWAPSGVTAQFTDDAASYHQRYFDRLAFTPLVERCLDLAGVERLRVARVLDIGSGSGASVLALAHLLPQAEVFASDISPQLLTMLAQAVESSDEIRGRVTSLCFDLHRPVFRPATFDLVLGCAVLHHLVDPLAALANLAAGLRPGGRIVLVEPLEAGSLVLTAIFADVLDTLARRGERNGELAKFMRAMRLDIQSRLGVPAEKPWTRRLDDKWVFDRPYLKDLCGELGLSRVDVYPVEADLANVYEKSFTSLVSDAGLAAVPIPDDVREVLRGYDEAIGAKLKGALCPTGIIVFA